MEQSNRRATMDPAPLLMAAYAGMGRHDEVLDLLEKAVAEHSSAGTTLKIEPLYEQLRGEPRFVELRRRVSLAP